MTEDIVKSAQERWKRDKTGWQETYDKAKDDLHFLSDDPFAQWDKADYDARTSTGRPAITIDQLNQFVHQVANDIRMNTPTINVIPGDKDSSKETAEVYKGLIRNIEYCSNADDAYDTAALNAVKSSIGFIRVDHEYVDDESFDQQLCIKRVINPLSCLIDTNSIECDGSDAKHGTIIDQMLVTDFKAQHPGFEPVSFEGDSKTAPKDDEYIAVAEHFVIVEESREVGLTDTGEMADVVEGQEYKSKRKFKKTKVMRYKLSGKDVLEETRFPGKYIPLIPVYGEEAWVEGKRHIHSLIRKSKQAQKMYNFWKSLETELLMKQPQAPVMAAEGQIEDYAADWREPNKAMVLRYKQKDANGDPAGKPERLAPPTIPTGIINAARETVDDIKATMGMYNASLGAKSNETSGIAINQRKQEGDVATFHFGDNLVRSIAHCGRVLVCAAPEIYDTQRILRIIGEEDEPKSVGVNGLTVDDQEETFDLTKGRYDVKVITGAPFTTRRQETVAALTEVFKAQPELMQVMGDIYFKNSDFAGSQAMASRMEKLIDPKLLEDDKGAQPPDPEKIQMAQVIQQLQAQMAELQQAAQDNQNEAAKLGIEDKKANIDAQAKDFELGLKAKELELKEREFEEKYKLENEKVKADMLKARLDAKSKVTPDVAMSDPDMQEEGVAPMAQMIGDLANLMAQGFQQLSQQQAQGNQAIIQAVMQPRQTKVIRDEQGRISGGVSSAGMVQ